MAKTCLSEGCVGREECEVEWPNDQIPYYIKGLPPQEIEAAVLIQKTLVFCHRSEWLNGNHHGRQSTWRPCDDCTRRLVASLLPKPTLDLK